MKTRPKELTGLALILVGVAISFPLQILWLFGDNPLDIGAIINKFTPLNWAVIGSALVLIPAAWQASPLFWALAPAFLGIVFWNNCLVASVQGESWLSLVHLSSLGMMLVFVGVLRSPVCRRVLMKPSTRWWLTPQRHRVKLSMRLCPVMGGEMSSQTFDLSKGGLFITLQDAQWRPMRRRNVECPPPPLNIGSYCWVRVALNPVSAFTCTAEIVRKTEPQGIYPGGVGLRFVGLTSQERKALHAYLKQLSESEPAHTPQPSELSPENSQAA